MKRIVLATSIFLVLSAPVFGQDASTAWRDILRRCARTDLIGRQSLFFGVSNLIGPGSIWRRADDNSIRLVSVLSDAVPKEADQAVIVKSNNVASCTGNSTSRWNIRLGLPFSTGATPLSLNIGAILGGAHDVSVSVKGYAVDALDESQWKKAFSALGPDNGFYKDALGPNRLLAENSVKVTGFIAVFNFKHDLSADVQAQFKGKTFTLGNSSSGGSGAGNAANTSTPSTPSSATSSGGGNSNTGCSSSSSSSAGGQASNSGTSNSNGSPSANNAATLHIDFSGSRQITICVDGPFYLISAYSNLVNANPIGIVPTEASFVLSDATLPTHVTAASDRKDMTPHQ